MISLYAFQHGQGLMEIEVEFLTFPGGEEHVKLDPATLNTRDHLVIDARVANASDMLRVLVLEDAIRRLSEARLTLFIPYLPGARQDRGAPLSAMVYANLINECGFDRVITVDPHSDVMPALIDRLDIISIDKVFPVYEDFPGPAKAVLLIPDAGAVRRVQTVADKWGYQTVQCLKKRDSKTGALSGFEVGRIPDGADAIIVDDICDGGGTFIGISEAVASHYPKGSSKAPGLYLWTTHGIYSKRLTFMRHLFRRIASTDSFPIDDFMIQAEETLTRVPLRPMLEAHLESTRYT